MKIAEGPGKPITDFSACCYQLLCVLQMLKMRIKKLVLCLIGTSVLLVYVFSLILFIIFCNLSFSVDHTLGIFVAEQGGFVQHTKEGSKRN
jgi:uncharacterized membrane protein